MSFVRIRLTFQHSLPHTELKNCWFLVDTSSCNTVADLEYLIRKRFKAPSKSCYAVKLFLDDFLLPSQEKIEIIQNNDHIRVEIQQTTEKQIDKKERDEQAVENKGERNRKKSNLPNARDKPKKKQVERNKQVVSDRKIKGNNLPKKRVQNDNEMPMESKKAKRDKVSSQDSKKVARKDPKPKKEAKRRHKSKLSSVVGSDVGALLSQEKMSSTKAFSSTTSSQMKKLNKPLKGKSTIQQKQTNGIKVSLQSNIHKRKAASLLLKTDSKKGKHSGEVTLGGDRNAIDSDSTTSNSSSSADESRPTRLPSKVKVSTSLTSVTQRKVDSDESKKDAHRITSKETNEKQGKNTCNSIPKSSLTLWDVSEGTRNDRSFSSPSESSRGVEKSENSSVFSHGSGKVNSRTESTSKNTFSSLENPALSSRTSFQSPNSAYSQTLTRQKIETSDKQSATCSNTKQMNTTGQVRPLSSANERHSKKPESSQETSHIRFDSDESEEESIDKQQENTGLTNGNSEHLLTNAGLTPYFPPCTQNQPPETPEAAVSELKETTMQDYSLCTPLHGPPRSRDKIAYKILELSASYTPEISDYKEGTVLAFDPSSGTVKIELSKESLKKSLGDGNVTGKFDLVYDENEENGNDEEEETETVVPWNSMIDPVLVE